MTPEYEAVSPNTDPARLAELAQTHPQLRPMIAANPAAYDGLLQWMTQFDEPGLKSALAARGYAAAPVVEQKKRRVPLAAIIIGGIVALLLIGVGVTALVISLNQAPPSSTSSSKDDDEEDEDTDDEDADDDEDANDDPVDSIPTCTVDQVLSVFYGDVEPDTVDLAGSFTLPDVLDASTTTVCAGDYFSTDANAFKQGTSVAVLEDDGEVVDRLSEILSAAGFSDPVTSGMSTTGWTDGDTQVYALNLEDAVYTGTDEFDGLEDKLIVFVWEA